MPSIKMENSNTYKMVSAFIENNADTAVIFATSRYAAQFWDVKCDKYYVLVGNESKRL